MEQIVDLERRIELALNEIERSLSLYSRNSRVGSEPANEELEKLSIENKKLEAAIEELKANTEEANRLNEKVFKMMAQNIGKSEKYFLKRIHEKGHADWYLTPQECKKINLEIQYIYANCKRQKN